MARYVGRLYLAESLIKLDKISEAIQEFSPDKITDISTSLEPGSQAKAQGQFLGGTAIFFIAFRIFLITGNISVFDFITAVYHDKPLILLVLRFGRSPSPIIGQ